MSAPAIAAAVARLEAMGTDPASILSVVKDMLAAEAAHTSTPTVSKSSAAVRQERYRAKKASQAVTNITRDVTRDAVTRHNENVTSDACDVTNISPSRRGALAEPELTNLEITGKKNKKVRTRKSGAYPKEFDFLVHEYRENDRTVKALAFDAWSALSELDRDRCLDAIGPYHELLDRERRGGFNRSACGLQVFIKQRRFDDLLGQKAA